MNIFTGAIAIIERAFVSMTLHRDTISAHYRGRRNRLDNILDSTGLYTFAHSRFIAIATEKF
ncbi:hypothetical protein ASF69_08935 [Rhizobium sp. Leaf311]|nr:hypothetical protein ASF69_08935 [Rhizobium sp. Leaf311]